MDKDDAELKEVMANLDFLMTMEVVKEEDKWNLLKDMDAVPGSGSESGGGGKNEKRKDDNDDDDD